MFKRSDYIIFSIICFFLGIFFVTQYFAGREYQRILQPETDAVLAVEVAKLTKSNADLRMEVSKLTQDLSTYKNNSVSGKTLVDKYNLDMKKYDRIAGSAIESGQGVTIRISGKMSETQLVDLINSIKNIGSGFIQINDSRINLNSDLGRFASLSEYQILVIGNSELLKTSLERKGGIVEQISTKDLKITVSKSDNLNLQSGEPIRFFYGRPIYN